MILYAVIQCTGEGVVSKRMLLNLGGMLLCIAHSGWPHNLSLTKRALTFDPISCIGSKFILNEYPPWSELHIANRCTFVECWEAQHWALFTSESREKFVLTLYRKVACVVANGAMLTSYTMLMVAFPVQGVTRHQNLSFQGWQLCSTSLFIQYFSKFGCINIQGALSWLNAETLETVPFLFGRLARWVIFRETR